MDHSQPMATKWADGHEELAHGGTKSAPSRSFAPAPGPSSRTVTSPTSAKGTDGAPRT